MLNPDKNFPPKVWPGVHMYIYQLWPNQIDQFSREI